jgi:hypothetical protein
LVFDFQPSTDNHDNGLLRKSSGQEIQGNKNMNAAVFGGDEQLYCRLALSERDIVKVGVKADGAGRAGFNPPCHAATKRGELEA